MAGTFAGGLSTVQSPSLERYMSVRAHTSAVLDLAPVLPTIFYFTFLQLEARWMFSLDKTC